MFRQTISGRAWVSWLVWGSGFQSNHAIKIPLHAMPLFNN